MPRRCAPSRTCAPTGPPTGAARNGRTCAPTGPGRGFVRNVHMLGDGVRRARRSLPASARLAQVAADPLIPPLHGGAV